MMKKSDFQFKNPRLVDIEFVVNKDFANIDEGESDLAFNANVNINKFKDLSEAVVELTITIGTKEQESPFYIKATEGAIFRWNESVNGKEDQLLEQNAPAILIGYLRPIISMITAASPFEAYNIPAINFME